MNKPETVRNMLVTNSVVKTLCGDRIFHGEAIGDPAYPYITFQFLFGTNVKHLLGNTGLKRHEVQVDVWGYKAADLERIGLAIDGLTGGSQQGTLWVWNDEFHDATEAPTSGQQKGLRRLIITLVVWI